jgi:hypothetical protein
VALTKREPMSLRLKLRKVSSLSSRRRLSLSNKLVISLFLSGSLLTDHARRIKRNKRIRLLEGTVLTQSPSMIVMMLNFTDTNVSFV